MIMLASEEKRKFNIKNNEKQKGENILIITMDKNWREKLRLSQAEAAGLAWPPPSASWKKVRTS